MLQRNKHFAQERNGVKLKRWVHSHDNHGNRPVGIHRSRDEGDGKSVACSTRPSPNDSPARRGVFLAFPYIAVPTSLAVGTRLSTGEALRTKAVLGWPRFGEGPRLRLAREAVPWDSLPALRPVLTEKLKWTSWQCRRRPLKQWRALKAWLWSHGRNQAVRKRCCMVRNQSGVVSKEGWNKSASLWHTVRNPGMQSIATWQSAVHKPS